MRDARAHLRYLVDNDPELRAEYELLAPRYRLFAMLRRLRTLDAPSIELLERRFLSRPRHMPFGAFVRRCLHR